MAVLQFDGFDHYGATTLATVSNRNAFEAAGFAVSSTTRVMAFGTAFGKNAGSYGMRLVSSTQADSAANQVQISKPIKPEQWKSATPYAAKDLVILGYAFRMALNPTAELIIGKVGDHDISVGIDMFMLADGVPTAYQIELAIWNYVEIEVNARDSKYRVWMNDIMISEKTLTEQVVNFDKWEIKALYRANGTAGQSIMDVDDYYLLDGSVSATSVATVRLGKINVATRFPTSDSEVAFGRDSGTTNFSRVSEQTPAGDTSYVYSGTVGATDLYGNATALTVIDDNAIVAVAVAVSARQTEPDSLSLAPMIKNGGQTYTAERMGLKAAAYSAEKGIFELDPSTGVRWKPAGVVTATFGPKVLDKVAP